MPLSLQLPRTDTCPIEAHFTPVVTASGLHLQAKFCTRKFPNLIRRGFTFLCLIHYSVVCNSSLHRPLVSVNSTCLWRLSQPNSVTLLSYVSYHTGPFGVCQLVAGVFWSTTCHNFKFAFCSRRVSTRRQQRNLLAPNRWPCGLFRNNYECTRAVVVCQLKPQTCRSRAVFERFITLVIKGLLIAFTLVKACF